MLEINKVYNEDCMGGKGMCLIPDKSVDMVLTDIPYLESKETNFKAIKDFTKKQGETEYSCMNFGEWDKHFDVDLYIRECFRILKPSRSIIVWAAWQQLNEIDLILESILKKKKGSARIGVWEKTNPSVFNMQRMALQPFEFFIWNRKGSNWTFNNQQPLYEDDKGIKRQTPERHYYRHSCIQGGHPTSKPSKIFEDLIKTYTNEGDIVFDGCGGSGTTFSAAKKNNRNYIGFEWNPAEPHDLYFKDIEKRLNAN